LIFSWNRRKAVGSVDLLASAVARLEEWIDGQCLEKNLTPTVDANEGNFGKNRDNISDLILEKRGN
jgi:hypothetical protein